MRRVVRRRRLKFRPSTRCACQSDGAKKASLPIDGPVNWIGFRPENKTIGPLQRKFCERECESPQRLSKKGGARWIQDTERESPDDREGGSKSQRRDTQKRTLPQLWNCSTSEMHCATAIETSLSSLQSPLRHRAQNAAYRRRHCRWHHRI